MTERDFSTWTLSVKPCEKCGEVPMPDVDSIRVEALPEIVRRTRAHRGLSVEVAAAEAGLTVPTYQRFEALVEDVRGTMDWTQLRVLHRLATWLGRPIVVYPDA